MKRCNRIATVVFAGIAINWLASAVLADLITTAGVTFTGSATGGLSGSVTFKDLGNGSLQVTLANTDTTHTSISNGQMLEAVFFDLSPNTQLDPNPADGSSVVLGPSSSFVPPSTPASDLPNGWGYYYSTSSLGSGVTEHQGITAAGYSIGGGHANFGDGSPLQGAAFGIVGPSYSSGGTTPLVKGSVVFTLPGLAANTSVSNIRLQWGTGLDEPSGMGTASVPEPTRLVALFSLCGIGLVGLVWRRRWQPA